MALVQPFLCLQVCVPADASFNVEILVSDDKRVRRRLMLSTAFKDVSTNPLHAQLPLACMLRDQWLNLCIDCAQLSADCFRQPFRAIEALTIAAHCTLRKVFRYRSVGDRVDPWRQTLSMSCFLLFELSKMKCRYQCTQHL